MQHATTLASIVKRERLTKEGSEKETYHLELDLSKSNIQYSVGDCIGIYPENDEQLVEAILKQFPYDPETIVDQGISFREFLLKKANLLRAPKKLSDRVGKPKVEYLISLLPCNLTPQEFCSYLAPMLPRLYSIASSMKHAKNRADLTITINANPPDCPTPYGTCSHFLCHRAPIGKPIIELYHHKSESFCLPEASKDKPIIMVGPGTGVAPFRGFMQERSCPRNWLFFGEQRQSLDFYYEQEWKRYEQEGKLRLTTAFSRDGAKKVYVQDKMLEQQAEIWQWLEEGAYLFVCGDAKRMAKDVEETLKQIIQNQSSNDPKQYIKFLKEQKRYLRDVY